VTADPIVMQRDTTVTDWTKDIDDFLADDAQSQIQSDAGQDGHLAHGAAFISTKVLPAFEQLKDQLERPGRGRRVDIQHISTTRAQLTIGRPASTPDGREETLAELQYTFEMTIDPTTRRALKIIDDGDGAMPEVLSSADSEHLTQTLIVNDVLRHWRDAVTKQRAPR
jgi:hypothetical protein